MMQNANKSRIQIKRKNLHNEYKGALFEYLIGEEISLHYNLFSLFTKNIPVKLLRFLKKYQEKIFNVDPQLIRNLPLFARESMIHLKKYLPENASGVFLVGKNFGDRHKDEYFESDIYVTRSEGDDFKLSLKLCKWNAFVNTKNGGVQSFIERYFPFPDAFHVQEKINLKLDQYYEEMVKELLILGGFKWLQSDDMMAFFLKNWQSKYSNLPGELPIEMREILFDFYFKIISEIYKVIESYYEENPKVFLESLYPLLGFGGPGIYQLNAFHHQHESLKGVHVICFNEIFNESKNLKIEPPKKGTSSFHLVFKYYMLQVRVKPMNSFMVKGLKVNCSVKHLS